MHDAMMLGESGLNERLAQFAFSRNGDPMCIYGDTAYPLRIHLRRPPFSIGRLRYTFSAGDAAVKKWRRRRSTSILRIQSGDAAVACKMAEKIKD